MNCDCVVAHGDENHCIGSSVISVLEPWKLFEAQFEIWQCCIIVKVATLRGLEKYAQIWTPLLIENRPECPKKQAD